MSSGAHPAIRLRVDPVYEPFPPQPRQLGEIGTGVDSGGLVEDFSVVNGQKWHGVLYGMARIQLSAR